MIFFFFDKLIFVHINIDVFNESTYMILFFKHKKYTNLRVYLRLIKL